MKTFLSFTLFLAFSSGIAAHSNADDSQHIAVSSPSLLRGGSLPEFLSRTNRCASRPNPLNCIDCIGPSGIGTRWTHAEACEHNAAGGYGVPYSCDKGQKFCCTESNIKETAFGNPDKYGTCTAIDGTGGTGGDKRGRPCAKDGTEVSMNLYPDEFSPKQNDISELNEACCSGKVGGMSCISGAWPQPDGRTHYSGSCDGICGADDTEVVWKVMYEESAAKEEEA